MRLGDLDALKEAFALVMWKEHNPYDTVKVCDIVNRTLDFIDNAPKVEQNWRFYYDHGYKQAERDLKRPQGEWNYIQAGMAVCPFCGATPHKEYKNFCPNCGASMKKGGAE